VNTDINITVIRKLKLHWELTRNKLQVNLMSKLKVMLKLN